MNNLVRRTLEPSLQPPRAGLPGSFARRARGVVVCARLHRPVAARGDGAGLLEPRRDPHRLPPDGGRRPTGAGRARERPRRRLSREGGSLLPKLKDGPPHQQGRAFRRMYSFDMAKARSLSSICLGAHWPWPQSACAWFAAHSCGGRRRGRERGREGGGASAGVQQYRQPAGTAGTRPLLRSLGHSIRARFRKPHQMQPALSTLGPRARLEEVGDRDD